MTDKPTEPLRLKLRNMTPEQIAPMERVLTRTTPDVWKDIGLSFFTTLLSFKNWREMREEQLAIKAMEGIGEDLGGTQPYIPTGANALKALARRATVLEMLAKGESYADTGAAVGLTETRVRKIENEERKRKRLATELQAPAR